MLSRPHHCFVGETGTMAETLQVFVATPLTPELCNLIVQLEPRIELVVDQELIPQARYVGDHDGDPSFQRTPDQQRRFEELCDQADALYGIPDNDPKQLARTIRANPKLRWVQTMMAGGGAFVRRAELTDEELARVKFTTSAGVHAKTLAEFAVFGVFAGAKDLPKLQRLQSQHEWAQRWPMRQIFQMTVLIVGMGHIGRETAKTFAALGARVIGVNRTVREEEGVEQVYPVEQLAELASQADAIVATLPSTSETRGMLDSEFWGKVKPGAIFVNVGRGSTVDEPAMIEALQDGRLSFAALDVFAKEPLAKDSPLWELPNVVIAPHTAALNHEEDALIARLFAENARRLLDGEELLNRVNTESFY